jgi:hypothetical protein
MTPSIPRINRDSIRIKPAYAKARHWGAPTINRAKAWIFKTAELTRQRDRRSRAR